MGFLLKIRKNLFLLAMLFFCSVKSHEYSLTPEQARAIMDYYNQKYNAKLAPEPGPEFFKTFKKTREALPDGTRLMWMFGIDSWHSVPLFYIKEDGQEAFFVYDSLSRPDVEEFINIVDDKIPFFYVNSSLQNDYFSCYMYSLLVGKYVTGHNSDGSKKIPHLIDFLKKHSSLSQKCRGVSNHRVYVVNKVPALLLKPAQRRVFIDTYFTDESSDFVKTNGTRVSFDSFLQDRKPNFYFMGSIFSFLRLKNFSMRNRFKKTLSNGKQAETSC